MLKDALDEKIEATRQEAAELRARLAEVEMRLSAYEEAARLRPGDAASTDAVPAPHPSSGAAYRSSSRRGGRQPGAISRRWRVVLKGVAAHYPHGATPSDIASFGPAAGLENLIAKDARRQAEKYADLGYMERIVNDRYRVTALACTKYDLLAEASFSEEDGHSISDAEGLFVDDNASNNESKLTFGRIHEGLSI